MRIGVAVALGACRPGTDVAGDTDTAPTDTVPDRVPVAPNVLIVLMDDVGRDGVGTYGQHPDAPPTPTLDALAADGVLFTHAWATPECSPTRAALLSGRYGRRTGVGIAFSPSGDAPSLSLDEVLLPEALRQADEPWATAVVGKWHLGNDATGGIDNPRLQGFDTFRGTVGNLFDGHTQDDGEQDYEHWEKVEDGAVRWVDAYATTEEIDDALELVSTLPQPWFVYLSLHAAHKPFHVPPAGLDQTGARAGDDDPTLFRAMVSALDTELGRLLASMPAARRARTTVFVIGDNGSPATATTPPFPADMAKKSVYEAGVGVPFVVSGAGVAARGAVCDALVSVVDVVPTVLALAGVAPDDPALPVFDGVSLVPWLDDPSLPSGRATQYAELFSPNGVDRPRVVDDRAISDGRFKLVVHRGGRREFYDLDGRVVEGDDLLHTGEGTLDGVQAAARERLEAALVDVDAALGGLR
ncbi:MAG: sulfatase-like hydrolase/transferase [Alphaproteobacteria bacterium]|nr:sulfatase-like hydrolase/transferase [Alphaproteobacteria bacterium]